MPLARRRCGLLALLALPLLALPASAAGAQARRGCGLISEPLRYAIAVDGARPSCASARSIVRDYLVRDDGKGKRRSVRGHSCSTAKGGTVAEGTAFRVTCSRSGSRIVGTYRGA